MPILYNIFYSKYLETSNITTDMISHNITQIILHISKGCTFLAVPNQVIVIQDSLVNIKRHLSRFLYNYSICSNMLIMNKMCKFQTQLIKMLLLKQISKQGYLRLDFPLDFHCPRPRCCL